MSENNQFASLPLASAAGSTNLVPSPSSLTEDGSSYHTSYGTAQDEGIVYKDINEISCGRQRRPGSTCRVRALRTQYVVAKDEVAKKESLLDVPKMQAEITEDNWLHSVRVLSVLPNIVDLVELYLESPQKGGGDFKNFTYDAESQHVTVVFEDPKVAERLVDLGSITLSKRNMPVTRLPVMHKAVADEMRPAEVEHEVKQSKVIVSGVEQNISESILIMYFENTRRSGGGTIINLTVLADEKKVIIEFENAEAAERVVQKAQHLVTGIKLQVSPFTDTSKSLGEVQTDETRLSCAITVKGFMPQASRDMIMLLFENRKRSGGGPIEDLIYVPEESRAVITFESPEVVDRVLQKHASDRLHLSNHQLDVQPLHPVLDSFEAFEVTSEVDKLRLIVFKLPMYVCNDDIEQYFKKQALCVQHVLYSYQPGVAMVEFSTAYDSNEVFELVRLKPLRDVMIGIKKVLKPDSVQVNNAGSLTDEHLQLYFENPRRFNSIEVKSVQLEEGFAVVKFVNLKDLSVILQQAHEIDGVKLEIEPYIENFSPAMPNSGRQPCWIPPDVSLSFDMRAVDFVSRRATVRASIEKALAELGSCSVLWPDSTTASVNTTVTICFTASSAGSGLSSAGLSKRCESRLHELLSSVQIQTVDVVPEMWPEFKNNVQRIINDFNKDELVVELDENSCAVTVIGFKDLCNQLIKKLSDQKAELEAEFQRRKTVVTDTLSFPPHRLALLKKCGLLDELPKEELSIEIQSDKVSLKGMTDVLVKKKLAIYELLTKSASATVSLSDFVLKVLQKKEFVDYVVDCLKAKSVSKVLWEHSSTTSVTVYGVDQREVDITISVLKSAFLHRDLPLDGSETAALKVSAWAICKSQLLSTYATLEISESGSTLALTYSSNIAGAVLELIQNFLREHAVRSEIVPVVTIGVTKIIELYLKDDLGKICSNFTSCAVTIRLLSKEDSHPGPGYVVSGTVHGLKTAVEQLKALTRRVFEQEQVIDRPGITQYLRGPRGKKSIKAWCSENSAFIEEVNDKDTVARNLTDATSDSPCLVAEVKINSNFLLKIVVGDITNYAVDVIVNAANTDLDHAGGVARAIVDKGGRTIQDECAEFVKTKGRLLPARFFVSSPGRLQCKAIIHAVGPIWSNGNNNEVNILFQTVFDALTESNRRNFSSIALPAISTGLFRFPLDLAVKTILEAILEFSKQTKVELYEVHLIDQSSDTVQKFAQISETVFKKVASVKWHKESGLSKAINIFGSALGFQSSKPSPTDHRNSVPISSLVDVVASSAVVSGNTLRTAEGIMVNLVKGSIVDQQVEVIVNTTSHDLNLANGAISRLIVAAAGPQIQSECQQAAPNGVKHGEVVVTKGYGLKCTSVYHGACLQWDNDAGKSEKVLRKFVKEIFKKAHLSRVNSIAMPAIGTGNLRIPAGLVARWMLAEVEDFSQRHRNTSLRDIRFVIYAKDTPTLSAFESEMRNQTRSVSTALPPPGGTRKMKKSGQDVKDPDSSATNLSGDWVLKIENLTVVVKQGDITKQRTDVIVNLTNATLQLEQGAVSKSILNAAGPKLMEECQAIVKSNGWKNKYLAVTSSGNLKSKNVYHVAADLNTKDVIKACLEEADSSKMESISFPLIGTGNAQRSPAEMATMMLEAITSFCAKRVPVHLALVQIIIFSPDMFASFEDGLNQQIKQNGSVFNSLKEFIGIGKPRRLHVVEQPQVIVTSRMTNSMRLRISALSEESIKKVLEEIQEVCNDMCKDRILDEEVIAQLTDEQVARIQALDNEHAVKIDIQKGLRLNRICITGLSESITEVVTRIYAIFREVDEEKRNQMESNLISKEAQWMYQVQDGYEAYPAEINAIIEQAYRNKSRSAEWEEHDDERFIIVFGKMVEQKVGDDSNTIKVKRNTPDSLLPLNWDPMASDESFVEVKLSPLSNEYKEIEKRVTLSASNCVNQIFSISRLQNPTLYRQYKVRKEQMERSLQGAGIQVERMLWHGTGADTLESISLHGFNRSYCGKNAIVYGRGVYFAVNFSYSAQNTYSVPDTTGNKHIYLTRVLTGEYVVGNQSYIVPPTKTGGSGTADRYNSVVDNPANPQVFVIFSDTQAYPEYLIVFN